MPVDNQLHKASHKGDLNECRKYIEGVPEEEIEIIDINEPGAADRRALHRSAGAGHFEVTQYLLEKGAILDLPDKNGRTALHWAAISGHTNIVKLLLERGANITATTTTSMNVLHGACEGGRVDTVTAIMEFVAKDEVAKATITTGKNDEGKTPWDVAFASKNAPLCQVLKDMGDVNALSATCIIC